MIRQQIIALFLTASVAFPSCGLVKTPAEKVSEQIAALSELSPITEAAILEAEEAFEALSDLPTQVPLLKISQNFYFFGKYKMKNRIEISSRTIRDIYLFMIFRIILESRRKKGPKLCDFHIVSDLENTEF